MKDGFTLLLWFFALVIMAPALFFLAVLVVSKGPMFMLMVALLLACAFKN
jgi:hypothetical protein